MWRRRQGPFVPLGDGRVELRLADDERQVLANLLPQLAGVLAEPDDPGAKRLYPTAYPTDAERDAEYHDLMRDELRTARSTALQTVLDSLEATEIDEGQLMAWLQTLNAGRLVLGTRLDVGEDDDPADGLDPDNAEAPMRLAYLWLSELLEHATRAAGSGLR